MMTIETISEGLAVMVFILIALLIGIVIEGINEMGFQRYTELSEQKLLYKPKMKNPEAKQKTFVAFLLWHIFRKVGVIEACIHYWKKEKNEEGKIPENSLFAFMCDPNSNGPVPALTTCARYIESKEKNNSVNRFRDMSFICQLARFSFFCIAILSLSALIIVAIVWCTGKAAEELKYLFLIYLTGAILSVLLNTLLTKIAIYFGRRYIRDIGRAYNSIKMDLKDNENTNGA